MRPTPSSWPAVDGGESRWSRRAAQLAGVAGLVLLLLSVALVRQAPVAQAQLTGTKSCSGPEGGSTVTVGDEVNCTVTLSGTTDTANPTSGTLNDIPAGSVITISAVGSNYTFISVTCTATGSERCTAGAVTAGGTTATITCTGPASCSSLTIEETLRITALTPTSITQQISVSISGQSLRLTATGLRIVAAGRFFFVSTTGLDTNNCQSRTNACATVNRALEVARDGDTIQLLGGTYTVARPIRVTKLVTIEPDGDAKVVLKANPGVTIFDVTAQGGPNLRVIIRNFTMGGNLRAGSSEPAIRLFNDGYTEIANNIIGGEDLPINNGVVIGNSLRPNIRDNTFLGSTQFVFTPLLLIGQNVTGFGVVSVECLGLVGGSVSSNVTVTNNLFTNTWTAGVWLCADGGGRHEITTNVFRNYWRGIVFKDVDKSIIRENTLVAGRSDGIILYGASLDNRVERNQIESHVGVDAAGIRVGWIADPIVPLANTIDGNRILRDTIGIHVFGARTTRIVNNNIAISGARTAILLTPSTYLLDPGTQPFDTEIQGNTIIFNGPCALVIGCAIRLLGVTEPVLATDNDFGRRLPLDVEGVIRHQVDDERLGLVTFIPFRNMAASAALDLPGASPTRPSDPGGPFDPTRPSPFPSPSPSPLPGGVMPNPDTINPSSPSPSPSLSARLGERPAAAVPAPVTTVPLNAGCTRVQWPGVAGANVVDAAMGITPTQVQATATIWRSTGSGWQGWSPARNPASDTVFTIGREEPLVVCVSGRAEWTIVTRIGE